MWVKATLASLCGAAGLALAAHYPLGGWLAATLFIAIVATAAMRPGAWLVLLPAAVALLGLAPWTGWITFEELDIAVLAVAAGGYLRLAWRPAAASPAAVPLPALLLAALFAVSLLISAFVGVADAGGFSFGWFQGYHGPMNSVRLAKSFFLAALLLPLWRRAEASAPERASARVTAGLTIALAAAALAALWERIAYVGLLDFSSDYRTTSLFWEMHVGGAAFDGFLALTVPFAVRELHSARSTWRALASAAVLLVASYACLTTFSRGVFLAVPLGVIVTLWLAARQRPVAAGRPRRARADRWAALGLALTFVAAAAWMFSTSGYRGMLALLGGFALALRLGGQPRTAGSVQWGVAVVAGAMLSALVLLAAFWLPKGAYIGYALALGLALLATVLKPEARWAGLAGFFAVLAGTGAVALEWGGRAGLWHALPAVLVGAIAAPALAARGKPAWPASLRWQGTVLAGLVAISGLIGVLSGGAYLLGRVSTTERDLAGRFDHWREGIAALRSPAQRTFGIGLGRYPAYNRLEHSSTDAAGDYDLRADTAGPYLALIGGRHWLDWGEMLRVSQRIGPPQPPLVATARVRATQNTQLHFEVCERHLLYTGACLVHTVLVKPTAGAWVAVQAPLDGATPSRGAWYAPRLISFSVANTTRTARIDVADLELRDAVGNSLLENGDFSRGMAHWFSSSDRHHLPWHLKNIFVHTLFEQGTTGLALLVCLLVAALWRLAGGSAREHPLAPAIGGAIVGFLVVGLFDSLLDVPRDAFFFHALLLAGLTLRARKPAAVPPDASAA